MGIGDWGLGDWGDWGVGGWGPIPNPPPHPQSPIPNPRIIPKINQPQNHFKIKIIFNLNNIFYLKKCN